MKRILRASLIGATLAAVGTAELPALAQTRAGNSVQTYVVTSQNQSATGTTVLREMLALRPEGAGYRVFLASADGTTFSAPVRFTPEGAIASNSQDGAITCYNMAMRVLASEREPARDPAAVFVLFAGSVVRIPLDVSANTMSGKARSIALTGESRGVLTSNEAEQDAGIIIRATIDETAGDLRDATFDETHFIGTESQVAGRSTCTLRQTTQQAARLTPV